VVAANLFLPSAPVVPVAAPPEVAVNREAVKEEINTLAKDVAVKEPGQSNGDEVVHASVPEPEDAKMEDTTDVNAEMKEDKMEVDGDTAIDATGEEAPPFAAATAPVEEKTDEMMLGD
jgi:hypothetical protein